MHWARACSIVVLGLALPGVAAADDRALAEVLFREGRALVEEGKLAEGCAKLAESQRLDPSSGTLLNLAGCHEARGLSATAWGEYLAAGRLARAQGKVDRATEADRRAGAVEPRVGRVRVSAPSAPGAVLVRDGEVLGPAVFGTRMPLDAGQYGLEVRATGYVPWKTVITVVDGQELDVPVPALRAIAPAALAPAPLVSPPPLPLRPSGPSPAYVAGWAVLGTGLASLAAGAILGGSALGEYTAYDRACPTHVGCAKGALDSYGRADALGWGANVTIPVGIAAAIVGVVLVVTQRPAPRKASAALPLGVRF